MVVKKYPDGTRVLVRLSEVQKGNGANGQNSANPSANGAETVYYAPGQTTNKPVSTARLKVAEKPAPQKSSPSPQAPSKPTSVATPSPAASPPEESSPTARFQVGGTPVSPGFDRTMYSGMGPSLKYGQSFQDYAPKSVPTGPLSPGVKTQTEAPPAPPPPTKRSRRNSKEWSYRPNRKRWRPEVVRA